MLDMVKSDPYIPAFTRNQAGMQGIDASCDEVFQASAKAVWLSARDSAIFALENMNILGAHKQDVNRLIEPFLWHTVVITATNWANFFALRIHPLAHPAIQIIAGMMADAMEASVPKKLLWGHWHLPYITPEDVFCAAEYIEMTKENFGKQDTKFLLCQMSAARCARVSYMRQMRVTDIEEDIKLFQRLSDSSPKHSSALEHQAKASLGIKYSGNFIGGWQQFRKTLAGECITNYVRGGLVLEEG
jgi:thymidylate synthase ThyX